VTDGADHYGIDLVSRASTSALLAQRLASIARGALSLLLPPSCPACGRGVEGPPLPCRSCDAALRLLWNEARRLEPPEPISPFLYAGVVKDLVRRMKYRGDRAAAGFLGEMMAARLRAIRIEPGQGFLVPVPLHPTRLRERGFNQAERLARIVGRRAGLPLFPGLIRRVRWTGSQTVLDTEKRRAAVASAFRPGKTLARRTVPRGSAILVDDVWTTGATAQACRGALEAAGCVPPILVLTAARAELARESGSDSPSLPGD